jgi:cell division septum initiation protein DivIVA
MSIASDITGGVGGDAAQVFTLLSVVSNPEVYAEKLKALVEATEANKKIVALVGPASEIMQIRKDIEADKAAAKTGLADARKQASTVVSDANKKAKAILAEASEKRDSILADAQAKQAEAEAFLVREKEVAQYLDDQAAMIASREAELKASKAEVEKLRDEVLAQQKDYHAKAEALQKKITAFANTLG